MSLLDTEKLRSERIKLDITQTELANRVGIAANYYCEIEGGKKIPSLETFVAIVDSLRLKKVDYLLKRQRKAKLKV